MCITSPLLLHPRAAGVQHFSCLENVSKFVEDMTPPPPKKNQKKKLARLTSEAFSSTCLRGLPRPLFSVASFSFGETVPLSLMFAYLFPPLLRPGKQVAPVRTQTNQSRRTNTHTHTHAPQKERENKSIRQLNSLTATETAEVAAHRLRV